MNSRNIWRVGILTALQKYLVNNYYGLIITKTVDLQLHLGAHIGNDLDSD